MTDIYQVKIEDLSNLGLPMGMERTITLETRLFYEKEKAEQFISDDYYKRSKEKIEFKIVGDTINFWDMRFIGYEASIVSVE